jgi:uncharacterized protein (DUF1499 family)
MIFAGKRPTNLGVHESKLALCPHTPNCVSSQSQDTRHRIEPFAYDSTPTKALTNLRTIIQNMARTKVIEETSNYLYAEFTSAIMGFVDDVEFYLDEDAKVIHVRSASRLGQSDLGVNRKRVETIRAEFAKLNSNSLG